MYLFLDDAVEWLCFVSVWTGRLVLVNCVFVLMLVHLS